MSTDKSRDKFKRQLQQFRPEMMGARSRQMAVKSTDGTRTELGVLSCCDQCTGLDLSCEKEQGQGFWSEKLGRWSYHCRRMRDCGSVVLGRTEGVQFCACESLNSLSGQQN